jgi:secondary thiamine-phosphate synthase enzyme
MKSHRKELWLETPTRRAFLNITPQVEAAVRASGVQEGLCLVNAMHITASVFINDDESGLHADYERWLERLAPEKPHAQYDHNRTGEDPAAAGPTPTSSARSWAARSTAAGGSAP